jgi:hypothetical protein
MLLPLLAASENSDGPSGKKTNKLKTDKKIKTNRLLLKEHKAINVTRSKIITTKNYSQFKNT